MPVARLPIEAIQIAKQFTGEIDLLVKDVVMSRIDGGVLAQRLGPLDSNMRILYVSSLLTAPLGRTLSMQTMLSWRGRFFSES